MYGGGGGGGSDGVSDTFTPLSNITDLGSDFRHMPQYRLNILRNRLQIIHYCGIGLPILPTPVDTAAQAVLLGGNEKNK